MPSYRRNDNYSYRDGDGASKPPVLRRLAAGASGQSVSTSRPIRPHSSRWSRIWRCPPEQQQSPVAAAFTRRQHLDEYADDHAWAPKAPSANARPSHHWGSSTLHRTSTGGDWLRANVSPAQG